MDWLKQKWLSRPSQLSYLQYGTIHQFLALQCNTVLFSGWYCTVQEQLRVNNGRLNAFDLIILQMLCGNSENVYKNVYWEILFWETTNINGLELTAIPIRIRKVKISVRSLTEGCFNNSV